MQSVRPVLLRGSRFGGPVIDYPFPTPDMGRSGPTTRAMGILDRFKTLPKWKHADADIRLAGVHELPEAEQDVLAEVARTDADPRVRKAAVGKLGAVGTLSDILRSDADEAVRDEAAGVLLDIALGAFDADGAASLAALDAFESLPAASRLKQVVLVAKTAKTESVALAALARLGDDQKALATVARRSEHAPVRMAALSPQASPQAESPGERKKGSPVVSTGRANLQR